MSPLSRRSVRQQLVVLVLLASALAMLFVAAAVGVYEATSFRPRAKEQLSKTAEILGQTLQSSLDFSDDSVATQNLRTWREAKPEIAAAAVYDGTDRLLASDRRADALHLIPDRPGSPGFSVLANDLSLWYPITRKGRTLGHLFLVEELPSLYARLPQYAIMAGGVILALLVVGGVLLGGVQRRFLTPLATLVETTGRIARDNDFNFRAPEREDELGQLATSFNRMLDVVSQRDAALREAARRIEGVFAAATDVAIISTAVDGTIMVFNAGAERMLGYTASEVVGVATPLVFHLESEVEACAAERSRELGRRVHGFEAIVAPAREGQHDAREWTYVHRNGGLLQVHLVITAVRDEAGELNGYLGIAIDTTEARQTALEKARLEEQLRQSQKMEAVGRLAGGVAHDFNNMLNVILGNVELAADGVDPARPLFAELSEIKDAAERSAGLTRQLLAFARRQTIAPRTLHLNDTIAGVLQMLRRLIGEDIDLVWLPGSELWPVSMDPAQLDQVLANLCVNARDAISGVGKVTIRTGRSTFDAAFCADHPDFLPGQFTMLAVSDNGRGLDPELLQHIFEPFFTTKGLGAGTGLGLSTVFGIIKQNNGFITVDSEPGAGATFTVYLPRCETCTDVEGSGVARPPAPLVAQGETVLLVEDESALLELGKRMLTRLGYSLLAAGSPREAIRLAETFADPIHLLVTDVIMPEMNGQELASRIKAIKPGLRCLFVSGYTADVIADRGVLDDDVAFLQKPFTSHDLALKVRAALA